MDSVINLAAIVGEPACKLNPEEAILTNYLANKSLSEACKYNQINRYIFASTCSVYGAMKEKITFDENSTLKPLSLYARSKIQSEEGILNMEDENFSPTILRMGTLYGYSPRMRFDLVVNSMIKNAVIDKKIFVYNGGKQWRPFLHIEDAVDAYIKCLKADINDIKGQIFNVGSGKQNYRIIDIARQVKKYIKKTAIIIEENNNDLRSYSVSFKKIEKILHFKAKKTIKDAIVDIGSKIKRGEFNDINNTKYYNSQF